MESMTIAVIGAGPAGLYLADEMVQQTERDVRVDIYDRLPTPFGLLRYGVAPDHLKMKALAVPLQRTLDDERVRFIGNVEVGRDVSIAELREHYSAVVYTYGAAGDRKLGVAGEDLGGSVSAAEFVRWYSGHPDAAPGAGHTLSGTTSVVVIGAGNVALDVTRMLVKSATELSATDLPDAVLDALEESSVSDVHLLVRRGPAQVKFTSKELRELGELEGVDMVVDPAALDLSPEDAAVVESNRALARTVDILRDWSGRSATDAGRRVHVHFWSSPQGMTGADVVESVVVGNTSGGARTRTVPAQLVVRCVGYLGSSLDGLPFDDESGTIPERPGASASRWRRFHWRVRRRLDQPRPCRRARDQSSRRDGGSGAPARGQARRSPCVECAGGAEESRRGRRCLRWLEGDRPRGDRARPGTRCQSRKDRHLGRPPRIGGALAVHAVGRRVANEQHSGSALIIINRTSSCPVSRLSASIFDGGLPLLMLDHV